MTTPGQVAPDGAYVIGGNTWNYGQELTDSLAMGIIRPLPTPDNAIGQFADILMSLPLEVLQAWAPWLDGVQDLFTDVGSAVEQIILALTESPMWLSVVEFEKWLESVFNPIWDGFGELFNTIGLDLMNGPVAFLQSLFKLIFEHYALDFDSGPVAFIESVWKVLGLLVTDAGAFVEKLIQMALGLFGVDFSSMQAFFSSLFANIVEATGLDFLLGDPLGAIIEAITGVVGGTLATLTQWAQDVGVTIQQVQAAVAAGISSMVQALTGVVGGTLTNLTQWANQITTGVAGVAGAITAGVAGGVAGLVQAIFEGFHGVLPQLNTAVTAKEVTAAIAASMTSLQVQFDAMTAGAAAGTFSGTNVFEKFSTYNPGGSLGSKWAQGYFGSGSGTLGVTAAGTASMTGAGREAIARYLTATKTNYQRIGVVFATSPGWFVGQAFNEICGRMVAADGDPAQDYVFARLTATEAVIGCSGFGGETRFKTEPHTFNPGKTYWLECGVGTGERTFRLWAGDTLVMTAYDTANVSKVGTQFRFTGVGMYGPNALALPGQLAAFAMYDNSPPAYRGSAFKAIRTSTTNRPLNAGQNTFEDNYFTELFRTGDYLYNAATNSLSVGVTGWYRVDVSQYAAGGWGVVPGGGQVRAAVFKNGRIETAGFPSNSNQAVGLQGFTGSFLVYCKAGDTLEPGYISDFARADFLDADAAGLSTWWSVNFVNNNSPKE